MKWLDLNGHMSRHVYHPGRGPCLVLLHEMGGTIESWDLVMPLLPPDRAVLLPEMRGMGLSERVRGKLSFADLAGDIGALLDRLDIDDPVVISGCAVGGAVALQFALDYPARTAAVVPLDPALDTRPEAVAPLLGLADRMEADGMRAVEAMLLDRSYPAAYRERSPAHFNAVRGRWLANDPASFATYLRMLAGSDLFSRLSELTCPVVLGSGVDDILRPPQYVARVAARIAGASVVSLPAAHHVADHAPHELAKLLETVAASVGKPNGA